MPAEKSFPAEETIKNRTIIESEKLRPATQALQYYDTLKAKGVEARLLWFTEENHWVLKPQNSKLWHREFFAWLERFGGRSGARKPGKAGKAEKRTRGTAKQGS